MHEVLTAEEMAQADRQTVEAGPVDGYGLMLRAGEAVVGHILARYPGAEPVQVLCGPGNNGGDGYVIARRLAECGLMVELYALGEPRGGSDAERARADCGLAARDLTGFVPVPGGLVVDALFGAGLARPLEGPAATAATACADARVPVVAVDLPSGVSGDSGQTGGAAFRAGSTVTFARRKPGHLLYPGKALCGEIQVADIGIGDAIVEAVASGLGVNHPQIWRHLIPVPDHEAHKYRRGHCAVFSGGPMSTGAARLSCLAAARTGAGAVTLLSPASALQVNGAHLTSTMLARIDDDDAVRAFVDSRRPAAFVIGPGFGDDAKLRGFVGTVLQGQGDHQARTLILDADCFSAFAGAPDQLFAAIAASTAAKAVMTPHEGEFRRIFPDLADDPHLSKPDRARRAARRADAIIVYKGADTVIAAPDGRAAINANGSAWLATAGSGDVLAGVIAGLCAQGMAPYEAACAGVWLHAAAGARFGRGLVAEDLPILIPRVMDEVAASSGAGTGVLRNRPA